MNTISIVCIVLTRDFQKEFSFTSSLLKRAMSTEPEDETILRRILDQRHTMMTDIRSAMAEEEVVETSAQLADTTLGTMEDLPSPDVEARKKSNSSRKGELNPPANPVVTKHAQHFDPIILAVNSRKPNIDQQIQTEMERLNTWDSYKCWGALPEKTRVSRNGRKWRVKLTPEHFLRKYLILGRLVELALDPDAQTGEEANLTLALDAVAAGDQNKTLGATTLGKCYHFYKLWCKVPEVIGLCSQRCTYIKTPTNLIDNALHLLQALKDDPTIFDYYLATEAVSAPKRPRQRTNEEDVEATQSQSPNDSSMDLSHPPTADAPHHVLSEEEEEDDAVDQEQEENEDPVEQELEDGEVNSSPFPEWSPLGGNTVTTSPLSMSSTLPTYYGSPHAPGY